MSTTTHRTPRLDAQRKPSVPAPAVPHRNVVKRRWPLGRGRSWLVRRTLLVADLLGLMCAFAAAELLFSSASADPDPVPPEIELLVFASTLPLWALLAKGYGLYDRDGERTDHTTPDDLVPIFHLVTVGAWMVFASAALTGLADPTLAKLAAFWALAVVLVTLARAAARAFCRTRPSYLQNAVILGAGEVGRLVARKLMRHREYGINVIGFVDHARLKDGDGDDGLPVLGPPERLCAIVGQRAVERVVVGFPLMSYDETAHLIREVNELGVQVDLVPRLFELVSPAVSIHTAEGLPLVGLPAARLSRSSRLLKRCMDAGVAVVSLAMLAPLFLVVGILIKIDSHGPVFFRQTRMGRGRRTFRIFKFRTMVADADERKAEVADLNVHANEGERRMFKIPADPRMTRVGRLLRRYSLDELPQLINVLTGEMSLVGPRPLILEEDRLVNGWERRRLDLKPGMSGLWQVLGRSDIPFEEMIRLDYLYVTNWSIWSDVRLLLRTVPLVLGGRGV